MHLIYDSQCSATPEGAHEFRAFSCMLAFQVPMSLAGINGMPARRPSKLCRATSRLKPTNCPRPRPSTEEAQGC